MTEFLSTLPGGLVTGAVYALFAMGLVFIYKATRVPNFAYGALAALVASFHYRLVSGWKLGINRDLLFMHLHGHTVVQLGFWAAVPVSLVFAGLIGLVVERVVIRPFTKAPMVTHIIVTLALQLLLVAVTLQWFGANDLIVPNRRAIFARRAAFALGRVNVSYERLGVMLIAVGIAAAVYVFFRYTDTGLAIRASATDRDVASLIGVSARRLGIVSWVAGSMVAGMAGIMLASLVVSSNPTLLVLLSIKGFAAAIVGGLISFPIAVVTAFGIGLGEELVRHYVVAHHAKMLVGAPEVLTLGAVIVVLALRPRWIFKGIRDDEDSGVTMRAGAAGSVLARAVDPTEVYRLLRAAFGSLGGQRLWGTVRRVLPWILVAFAVGFPLLPLPEFWTLPANLTLIYLLVILSFVVVIGWLGQISMAAGAFIAVGGGGAAIAANTFRLPFPLPILAGVALSVPVSILVGLPAVRLRGLHLAVATLAFGLAAERAIVPRFSQGGFLLRRPAYLRSDTAKYYVFLVCAAAAMAVAWRVSRTHIGRSFHAIRDSETVAVAYGIRPVRVKLTGFVLSGAIAALAGTMLCYQLGSVQTAYASITFSIQWLAYAIVAGILSIAGPVIGALFFGLYPELVKTEVHAANISHWPEITSAILLIVIMTVNPEGLASMARFVRARTSAYDETDEGQDLRAIEAAAQVIDAADVVRAGEDRPAGADLREPVPVGVEP